MKHNYQERKENRIAWAKKQQANNEQKSEELHQRSNDAVAGIPPGQPILVDHYSGKYHIKALEKSHNAMRASIEAGKKAEYYADKAESIEHSRAISSDNPDAIALLEEKLKALEAHQAFMKATNNCIRKNNREAFLKLEGATEERWLQLTQSNRVHGMGFPSYELTNNNANLKRIKNRIAQLTKDAARTTKTYTIKGITIVENVEANRIQLKFGKKPPEHVRELLRKHGFIYSHTEGANQRFLNNAGIFAAKQFLLEYEP